MTELEKKLIAALRPFADMADVIDDAGDLVDDEDEREKILANIADFLGESAQQQLLAEVPEVA